ncbi:MAG: CocE/NonD family hydrolase [Terriglobia bacterium]|jgi:putative CocE/NonD family hydrolase
MKSHVIFPRVLALFSVVILAGSCGAAAAQLESDLSQLFIKTEAMIEMRDGVRLNTEIYTPVNHADPLPFLITRTPYGLSHDEKGFHSSLSSTYKELADEGFIFVFQDIRGRYKSEGQFTMLRFPRAPSDPKAIDEGTDTYDTIEWLLKNVPQNNGRVGILGISYGGWLTMMATLEPHPALKAVSEQASPADMYLGDDFHHNGAFRLSYGFEYAARVETGKTNFSFDFDKYDTFEWYLDLGPLANANGKYLKGTIPTWNDFVAHPNYDEFWQRQAVTPHLKQVTVPNLNVAGWFDQEDFYGPMKIYEVLETKDSNHRNFLVVGPWNHGGWSRGDGRTLGKINFASDTARYFRERVQAPWFAYWLKDKGSLPLRETLAFETGSNQWKDFDQWPPRGSALRKLYFHPQGRLSFDPPAESGERAFDCYESDPAHPVPYRRRPVEPTYPGPGWPVWLTEDQRFVDERPDVLSWESEPLKEDLTIAGDVVAKLFATTTGSDCDWIVKLIDVYPEAYPSDPAMGGYQLMIANEVFRARFRKSFEKPEAVVPNRVTFYAIDIHSNDHCFLKGHRLMVQVQSTWFPLIDRNPQKYVPNIFRAAEPDFQKATQRIYRSRQFPSHLELPVMTQAP